MISSILSILAGIILGISGVKVPDFVTGLLTTAGNCVGPCSMLLMGITLSEYRLKDAHLGAGLTMVSSMATIVTLPLWVHILSG